MANSFMAGLGVGLCGGGAIIWLFKDQLMKFYLGAEAFANKLQSKADAIKTTINALKN